VQDPVRGTVVPRVERWGGGVIAAYHHQVVPLFAPGVRDESGLGSERDRPLATLDPVIACSMLATAALEVISGARALAQLARWVTPGIYEDLDQRRRLALAEDGTGTDALLSRPAPGRGRPKVRRVRAMPVDDRVVEASVVLAYADRVHAVAMRMVDAHGFWRAEALVVG